MKYYHHNKNQSGIVPIAISPSIDRHKIIRYTHNTIVCMARVYLFLVVLFGIWFVDRTNKQLKATIAIHVRLNVKITIETKTGITIPSGLPFGGKRSASVSVAPSQLGNGENYCRPDMCISISNEFHQIRLQVFNANVLNHYTFRWLLL